MRNTVTRDKSKRQIQKRPCLSGGKSKTLYLLGDARGRPCTTYVSKSWEEGSSKLLTRGICATCKHSAIRLPAYQPCIICIPFVNHGTPDTKPKYKQSTKKDLAYREEKARPYIFAVARRGRVRCTTVISMQRKHWEEKCACALASCVLCAHSETYTIRKFAYQLCVLRITTAQRAR